MAPDSEDFVVAAPRLLAGGWLPAQRRLKSSARNKAACTTLYKIYRNQIEDYRIQKIQKQSSKHTSVQDIQNLDWRYKIQI